MQYCPYCGALLPTNAKFCPECGESLAANTIGDVSTKQTQRHKDSRNRRDKNNDNKKSLYGCLIILLIIAVIAAATVIMYNNTQTHSNALIPKEDTSDTLSNRLEEEEDSPSLSYEEQLQMREKEREAEIRKRVQRIYDDVLQYKPQVNYTGRYCTSRLYQLIQQANQTGEYWLDYDYWISAQDCDKPHLEMVKIIDCYEDLATVKVYVRPFRDGQETSVIELKMLKEDGAWLIDDFIDHGTSLKTRARRTIEESQIKAEIMHDDADTINNIH
ncbi:MAG: DUF3828 domain-containing protein [Bacteroidaceae bacterium]|nr:DUF3828 domain-containing protein [Bacteroidaceae bacterium]